MLVWSLIITYIMLSYLYAGLVGTHDNFAVTYMTEISLIVTLNKQFNSTQLKGRILWCGRPSVGLSTKLVNAIQTEPFQLGPSNLLHILITTRGQHLLIFKVRVKVTR